MKNNDMTINELLQSFAYIAILVFLAWVGGQV
jgi:hypothetical protein